ncbi:transporter substrate-binding domain-containing protein [Lentibacillus sp. CBA3610]|uniref:transporter substrate-binding domain-containing protein n=1 Tax=Lentibacillus sp. CBA3610 TaxID=2518176 RepID=UPI00350E57BA
MTLHPELKFHPTRKGMIMAEGADKLQTEVNQALEDMREDGTLTALAEEFYEEDASRNRKKIFVKLKDWIFKR